MPLRGLLVTFEGPEGSGKSTQSRLLAERLMAAGRVVVTSQEPGGTPLGEEIRHLVLEARTTIDPRAETLLFCAARAQLLGQVIRPSLEAGAIVLCDRYADSTLAYQHFGRQLRREWVQGVVELTIEGVWPDLTLLLDLPPRQGLARKRDTGNRFEEAGLLFHERVRDGYHLLAAEQPGRWRVIDALQPVDVVAEQVWGTVTERLAARLGGAPCAQKERV